MEQLICIRIFHVNEYFSFLEGQWYDVYWVENGNVWMTGPAMEDRFKFQMNDSNDTLYLFDFFSDNKPFKFGR